MHLNEPLYAIVNARGEIVWSGGAPELDVCPTDYGPPRVVELDKYAPVGAPHRMVGVRLVEIPISDMQRETLTHDCQYCDHTELPEGL